MTRPGPLWLLVAVPLVFAAISLPMALEWIGPNALYGVRTAATRASEAEWYRINRLSGIAGVAGGVLGFVANLLVARSDMALPQKQLTCLAVLLGVALLMVATAVAAT